MTNWIEIRAEFDTAPQDWSIYADALDRFNCPGSLIEDDPASIGGYLVEVPGADDQAKALSDELIRLGADRVVTQIVPEEDWAELWKQHFKPRRIGRTMVVRPTWETYEADPADLEIVLDPGQAFGTGDHPTTRLCLELLEAAEPAGLTLADVGCGSGILAIAAAKMGALDIIATDLDPLSVEVTRQNMALNGVDFVTDVAEGFVGLHGRQSQIVISNIISATLIRLAPDAARHTADGGRWIVSGIIVGNWPDVRKAAESNGFTLLEQHQEDDWVAATFCR